MGELQSMARDLEDNDRGVIATDENRSCFVWEYFLVTNELHSRFHDKLKFAW